MQEANAKLTQDGVRLKDTAERFFKENADLTRQLEDAKKKMKIASSKDDKVSMIYELQATNAQLSSRKDEAEGLLNELKPRLNDALGKLKDSDQELKKYKRAMEDESMFCAKIRW